HAVVPGKLDESELVRRITSEDASEIMPPPEKGKPLSQAQIALLKRWVEQGAPWASHWAFTAPRRPAVPVIPNAELPNPIDAFIRARLAKEGLTPAGEADKRTLIRRVTLD